MKDKLRYYLSIINHHINPYQYDEKYYLDTFLVNYPYNTDYKPQPINRTIYVFWTGNNSLTENRIRSLEALKAISEVQVELVTPNRLKDFILPNYPLHLLMNIYRSTIVQIIYGAISCIIMVGAIVILRLVNIHGYLCLKN